MTLKRFHLLKDRFLFDDYDSGLYFDLVPVNRNPGNENDFNARIDGANDMIVESDPVNQKWQCTSVLNETQMYALSAALQVRFGAKSYLLLYKAGFDGKVLPTNPWFEQGSGGMVCNPTGLKKDWLYYTNWDANMLGHRYRRVTKDEVLAAPGEMPPDEIPDEPPTPPDNDVVWDGVIHMNCPHCGLRVF